MCMHRFYVAPLEAAQSGHLPSYQEGIGPKIQEAMDCKVESRKKSIYNRKMRGLNEDTMSISDNPAVEFKH